MNRAQTKIDSGMSYDSEIKVSFNCKGRAYDFDFKNRGTFQLFDTITKSLAGYDVSNNIPYGVTFEESGKNLLKRSVALTGIVYGNAADASVTSDMEIPQGVLKLEAIVVYEDKDEEATDKSKIELVLVDREGNTLCRITDTNVGRVWEQITENTDALVEWKLWFHNK